VKQTPKVSVVCSAYNAEHTIGKTIESVLAQQGVSFELIVVDDGSTDATLSAINRAMNGSNKAKLIGNKANIGLTKSLVLGCQQANGRYIARVDAGDCYLPGRLSSQSTLLDQRPDIGLVSCGTRFLSGDGEKLYEVVQQADELTAGLAQTSLTTIRGPSHHGSTMFRKSLYDQVGGYRSEFKVAQDLDLWMRMIEASEVLAQPEILYESEIEPTAISILKREQQLVAASLILECARLRRSGQTEPTINLTYSGFDSDDESPPRLARAQYEYFIGSCLEKTDSASARHYFKRAWLQSPLNFKYGFRYLRQLIR